MENPDADIGPTLPDIPCQEGGVLVVGINPAPPSVAAGHYYQGRLGQRLWRRLEDIGLLVDGVLGREDEAFAKAGNGLTDLVKRPTTSAAALSPAEMKAGIQTLRDKIRAWRPGLLLFVFRPPAEAVLGDSSVEPGRCPDFEGIPTFLLTGPYAAREARNLNDADLKALLDVALGGQATPADLGSSLSPSKAGEPPWR